MRAVMAEGDKLKKIKVFMTHDGQITPGGIEENLGYKMGNDLARAGSADKLPERAEEKAGDIKE